MLRRSSRTGRSTASAPPTPARRSRSRQQPGLNCPGCGAVLINVNGDPKPTGSAARTRIPGTTSRRSRSRRASDVTASATACATSSAPRRVERGPRPVPLVPGGPLPSGDPRRGPERVQPHELGTSRHRFHEQHVHDLPAGRCSRLDVLEQRPRTLGEPARPSARCASVSVSSSSSFPPFVGTAGRFGAPPVSL